MSTDNYQNKSGGLSDPAERAFAITPSDTEDLAIAPRALYIGVGGDVKVDMLNGDEAVVFKNAAEGAMLPVRVTRVYATGTTATDVVGVY